MPCDTLSENAMASRECGRASAWLTAAALVLLAGVLLVISPDDKGERQRPWPAEGRAAWLHGLVRIQALNYLYPTPHGVEVKDAIFHVGACALSLIGAVALWKRRAAIEWKRALRSPLTWFVLVVLLSGVSAWRSGSPRAAAGGTLLRLFWLLWWWPLAVLLTPRDARRLLAGLCAVAAAMALVGLWYQADRAVPGAPLSYPLGSPLFLGACLLPGLMAASVLAFYHVGHALPRRRKSDESESSPTLSHGESRKGIWRDVSYFVLLAAVLLAASVLTGSRSARMGYSAGLLLAVYLAADRLIRAWLLSTLAVSCGLLAGFLLVSGDVSAAVTGVVDQFTGRSASIRARIEHEWPFAGAIFWKRPWLGSGEGGFGRMVGPYVRAGQIDDPTLLNPNASVWESHAHNELLEMLCDLGLLGTGAMAVALLLTLRAGRRAVEAETDWRRRAWLTAATAAFFAACVEELTDIALHKAGYAPVALSAWACLWAMTREHREKREAVGRENDAGEAGRGGLHGMPGRRIVAVIVVLTSIAALWPAVGNSQATRAYYRGERRQGAGEPAESIAWFDAAASGFLDPARHLNGLVQGALSRVQAAQQVLGGEIASSSAPPMEKARMDRAERLAREALEASQGVLAMADRYLRARELEGWSATLLARIAEGRGDVEAARRLADRARRAWRQNRDDEPFQMQALVWAWDTDVTASVELRLGWLREMLRGGEVESRWDLLLHTLRPGMDEVLRRWLSVAEAERTKSPDEWKERLLPETYRLAARASWLGGDRAGALQWAAQADEVYGRAGARLARAHGALLHEYAAYVFDAQPTRVADAMELLLRGYERVNGVRPGGAMAGNMGRTRLEILLFAGAEPEARMQASTLSGESKGRTVEQILSEAYVRLAVRFMDRTQGNDAARLLEWLRRATLLNPANADAWGFTATVALRLGRHDAARQAIEEYRRRETRKEAAREALERLRAAYPESPAWGGSASRPAATVGNGD